MAISIPRGTADEVIDSIISTLRTYETDHPRAKIDIYRQNSVSVRIRIIDEEFAGLDKAERSKLVWRYLENLPDEAQSDISTVLLLTPDETKKSFANFEFEDPVPSKL
jgi:stress-induced morphogen